MAGPLGARPSPEIPSREEPRLVVVRAEVRRAGVRDVDRDERDPRLQVLRRDRGRGGFVGLELDRQIDLLANQLLCVSKRHLWLVAVVDDDELDLRVFGRTQETGVHFTRKRSVAALRRVPDPMALL